MGASQRGGYDDNLPQAQATGLLAPRCAARNIAPPAPALHN
jgi:hypothetical protein